MTNNAFASGSVHQRHAGHHLMLTGTEPSQHLDSLSFVSWLAQRLAFKVDHGVSANNGAALAHVRNSLGLRQSKSRCHLHRVLLGSGAGGLHHLRQRHAKLSAHPSQYVLSPWR